MDHLVIFGSSKSCFHKNEVNLNRMLLLVIIFGGNMSSENDRAEK